MAYVAGWLFLPLISLNVQGLPPYGKFTATGLALMVGVPLLDAASLARFRPRWFDLPMLMWCLGPMATSLSNDLGWWNGLSVVFAQVVAWGVPYLMARIYITRPEDLVFFSKLVVWGALLYLPLCFYEMRMSPQVHLMVYGAPGRLHWESRPIGPFIWSPAVFMNSAFEVTMLYAMATLIALQAWRTRFPNLSLVRNSVVFPILLMTTLACRKWSGIGLMWIGLAAVVVARMRLPRLALSCMALVPCLYMALWVSGIWRGEGLVEQIRPYSERRADSLDMRIRTDQLLIKKAMLRPVLGWGGYGRHTSDLEEGQEIMGVDTMWMITLGSKGFVGLLSLILIYLMPIILVIFRFQRAELISPPWAVVLPLAVILGLQLIDMLFNAFPNAVYPMIAGSVSAAVAEPPPRRHWRGHRRAQINSGPARPSTPASTVRQSARSQSRTLR